jgi:biotin transport system substrate-specific component
LGLPVFASGGGFSYVLNPTFGYLLGFCAGAYLTGKIANASPQPSFLRLIAACFSGLLVVYLFGLIYYYIISNFYLGNPIGLWPLFLYGFILAVPGDIALCVLASVLGKQLIPLIQKNRV